MINYTILDDKYNKVIDDKCTIEVINEVINDKRNIKVGEFKNETNNTQVFWYQNINTKYIVIYEIQSI